MLRHNIIQNFPVMVEDIYIEDNIFSPDVSTLKGRKTRQIPKVVVDSFIEISRELIENNQGLIPFMEIMFINKQLLLTKIDKDKRFRGLVPLDN